jgi:hypothetical protein
MFVIPAKAGIQRATTCDCRQGTLRASGAPANRQRRVAFWILAFARMTSECVSRGENVAESRTPDPSP